MKVEEVNRRVLFESEEVASEAMLGTKDEPEIIYASPLSQTRFSGVPKRRRSRFATQLYASQGALRESAAKS